MHFSSLLLFSGIDDEERFWEVTSHHALLAARHDTILRGLVVPLISIVRTYEDRVTGI